MGQTSPSHVLGSYIFQLYQNAQVNQDMKVPFVWSKKEVIPKNLISKLELKFSKTEENMNSLESKLQIKCKALKQLIWIF